MISFHILTNLVKVPGANVPFCSANIGSAAAAAAAATSRSALKTILDLKGGANALPTGLLNDATEKAFDIARARIRLEGLSSYALIAALLMNMALRLYGSIPKKMNLTAGDTKNYKLENAVAMLCSIFAIICIVMGMTTTIIFSFLGLYSKTALGMGNDAGFVEFFSATAEMRRVGFQSMCACIICLKGSLVTSTLLDFRDQGKFRYVMFSLSLVLSVLSWMAWNSIVKLAGGILFH
mmetsp:Transcript_27346/g.40430  ORF Transcript_27346/g.40430 Transcript_27346/m.40430 type:complete len:237 (-) Transcript_27346:298-1008(-)